MRIHARFLSLLLAGVTPLAAQSLPNSQTKTHSAAEESALLHQSEDWQLIAPHLADPATANEAQLELSGDVLQARRFPEDALDYYTYAMKRGGDPATLLKKMGVVRLELRQTALARALFQQCVHMAKKDPQAWNNLAAADYILGANRSAIHEYKRALKLDKHSAVFHANLGIAYFADNDVESARTEFSAAMRLDPRIMSAEAEGGGITLHVLQTQNYGLLCFQMAKMYASQGAMLETKLWLQKAAEHGLDLHAALSDDSEMRVWLKNPEIRVVMANANRLQKPNVAHATPGLGTSNDGVPN
ncbi:tetratricopeptide repeat protein [Granulicella sp. 5B5]|uniref:tetratricopeptide repeat protein n=1 Tax=Granulicella sp. 5B5 TaxID=1617967 RepID=UPI0015F4EE41|nr:tetratricopeptide repeat protein [Granulicella sp. 5B5]QMV19279.1 tetratricopeptide repeat protein [Granulicella sp. 5B5]